MTEDIKDKLKSTVNSAFDRAHRGMGVDNTHYEKGWRHGYQGEGPKAHLDNSDYYEGHQKGSNNASRKRILKEHQSSHWGKGEGNKNGDVK